MICLFLFLDVSVLPPCLHIWINKKPCRCLVGKPRTFYRKVEKAKENSKLLMPLIASVEDTPPLFDVRDVILIHGLYILQFRTLTGSEEIPS